ncbi:MAG: glycosyltransferase [Bacteroidetes bacterium]|nr:glycosyltransferase [Bacteroidota bacterium]
MQKADYDLIIMTMSRWDGEVSSAILSLAKELAQHRRVFYWDHPFSIKDLLQNWRSPFLASRKPQLLQGKLQVRAVPDTPAGFRAVTPPLTLPVNFLPEGTLYEWGSAWNDRVLNRALEQLLQKENIRRYVFLNSFDPFFFRTLHAQPQPLLRIYQSRDDISQEPYIARHGQYLEREQLEKADLRLATSQGLRDLLHRPGTPVLRLANAADTGLFNQALEPAPLPPDWPTAAIGRPVIGYIGSFSALRLDYPLLRIAVNEHPDKAFVFLGSGNFDDQELAARPNVHLIGPRPLVSLPDYLRGMDLTVIPFLRNTLTSSIYPLKINEYLAAGKPVLSTDFSADVREFSAVVYLADSASAFSALIGKALNEDNLERRAARCAVADQNSWAARAATFEQLVQEALTKTATWAH